MKLLVSLIFLRNYVNTLPDSTAKKLVDSAICVILYLEVQIAQSAQHFAILVSINVTVYVKLVKPDAQYPILRHQLIFELQLFLQYRKFEFFFFFPKFFGKEGFTFWFLFHWIFHFLQS